MIVITLLLKKFTLLVTPANSVPSHINSGFKNFYNHYSFVKLGNTTTYNFLCWNEIKKAYNVKNNNGGYVVVGGFDEFTLSARTGPGINFNPQEFSVNATIDLERNEWGIGVDVNPSTIIETIEHKKLGRNFNLLKLDFDGYECDVLEAILLAGYRPKVIVIELNPIWVPPMKFALKYNIKWSYGRGQPFFYGCSVQYAADLLEGYGYDFLQYPCWDGWFIRRDLNTLAKTTKTPLTLYMEGNPTLWPGLYGRDVSSYMHHWMRIGQEDPRQLYHLLYDNMTSNDEIRRLMSYIPYSLSFGNNKAVTSGDTKIQNTQSFTKIQNTQSLN